MDESSAMNPLHHTGSFGDGRKPGPQVEGAFHGPLLQGAALHEIARTVNLAFSLRYVMQTWEIAAWPGGQDG